VYPRFPHDLDELSLARMHHTAILELQRELQKQAFNVKYFGAKSNGIQDDTPAIQAAIDAAADPTAGADHNATVFLPPGEYKINGTLNIGNGSQTSRSTVYGVRLVGAAPMGMALTSGVRNVNPSTGYYGAPVRLVSGSASPMIQINGPIPTWGLENLFLDGNDIGTEGIREISAQGGYCKNIALRGFTVAAQHTTTQTGFTGDGASNHQHNRYDKVQIRVPSIDGVAAIVCEDGGASGDGDSWGDIWDQMKITFDGIPPSGTRNYGIVLRNVDNERFNNVYFGIVGWPHFDKWPAGSGSIYTIAFHFNARPDSFGPADCMFDHVDLAATFLGTKSIVQWGAARYPNHVIPISTVNGAYPDPGLSGVRWGYSQIGDPISHMMSGPANPTTTELRVGKTVIWKNTTLNEVRLWVNDGGTLKKSPPLT